MADKKQLKILLKGSDAWNKWREKNPETRPDFYDVDLRGADLSGTKLKGARFSGKLDSVNFCDADLTYTHFSGDTTLTDANFTAANLSHAEFTCLEAFDPFPGIIGRTTEIRLFPAKLDRADFSRANFFSANLRYQRLCEANFTQCLLHHAIMSGADLRGAKFNLAQLAATELIGAHLDNADFTDAIMQGAILSDTDLSTVKGLETVKHLRQSSLGFDTIYNSGGKIPAAFLLGCGLPESALTYLPSPLRAENRIQFYSCFISYSSKDEEFARQLHRQMRNAQLRVWFAAEDIQAGKTIYEQIETAIRAHDKVLLVLSNASLQSEWVITELRRVRNAERESGKRKLFPVRLVDFETLRGWECFDADSGKDLAVELRGYFIPDFSNWKDHNQFEVAFSRLLNDLRAEERVT